MLHFLLSWAVLALLLLVFIIHFNAFTRTCTKRSVYVDQNHQTLLSMYCLIPSQHALNAALMQIRITVSSASWSSSIKNAERHIFFQKSQFCFFSLTTLMIHCRCKTFITELIYQQNQHSFYKVQSQNHRNCFYFTILSIQFTLANFITNLFHDFLSAKHHKTQVVTIITVFVIIASFEQQCHVFQSITSLLCHEMHTLYNKLLFFGEKPNQTTLFQDFLHSDTPSQPGDQD